MSNILLIDDEPDVLEATRFALEIRGHQVIAVATGEEGLERLKSTHPDILLIDFKLPGMSGLDFLKQARQRIPQTPAIIITGLSTEGETIEAECQKVGIHAFLHKPLQMEEVDRVIQEALTLE